ncbi:MAG: ScpA family protein [Nanoarchaeota archaeon]
MKQILQDPKEVTNDKIFSILFTEDELTWQNIIYELIETKEIDPWDVNIHLLAKKFIQKVRLLKEMDFRISGKVILAAAILLKIKSNKLLEEDIVALDNLINNQDEALDLLADIDGNELELAPGEERPKIFPRTPQPRKRKVSIFDLVKALEQALEVEERRKRWIVATPTFAAPKKGKELSLVIKDVYDRILIYFKKNANSQLTFEQLVPSDTREDKIMTFIPLLHLDFQRKVDIDQKEHFGTIYVSLVKPAAKN